MAIQETAIGIASMIGPLFGGSLYSLFGFFLTLLGTLTLSISLFPSFFFAVSSALVDVEFVFSLLHSCSLFLSNIVHIHHSPLFDFFHLSRSKSKRFFFSFIAQFLSLFLVTLAI
jgi:hypothetical protein